MSCSAFLWLALEQDQIASQQCLHYEITTDGGSWRVFEGCPMDQIVKDGNFFVAVEDVLIVGTLIIGRVVVFQDSD